MLGWISPATDTYLQQHGGMFPLLLNQPLPTQLLQVVSEFKNEGFDCKDRDVVLAVLGRKVALLVRSPVSKDDGGPCKFLLKESKPSVATEAVLDSNACQYFSA